MTWEQIGYVAAFGRRGGASKAAQKVALDRVAERLRRRDIAQQRLVNGLREALTIDVSLSSLAQALNINEDQVLALTEPDDNPESDHEPG